MCRGGEATVLVKFLFLAKHAVLIRAIPSMSVTRKNRNGKKSVNWLSGVLGGDV